MDVFGGLVPDGYVLINTSRTFEELGLGEFMSGLRRERLCTVPATELALKHVGRPVPNAALLAGFAAVSGRISLEAVNAAIREKFPAKIAEANVAAANAAYAFVENQLREAASA